MTNISPFSYFGITACNGMVGLISPIKYNQVQDIVLKVPPINLVTTGFALFSKVSIFSSLNITVGKVRLATSENVNDDMQQISRLKLPEKCESLTISRIGGG